MYRGVSTGIVSGGGVVSYVEAGRLQTVIFPCADQIERVSASCVTGQFAPIGVCIGAEKNTCAGNAPAYKAEHTGDSLTIAILIPTDHLGGGNVEDTVAISLFQRHSCRGFVCILEGRCGYTYTTDVGGEIQRIVDRQHCVCGMGLGGEDAGRVDVTDGGSAVIRRRGFVLIHPFGFAGQDRQHKVTAACNIVHHRVAIGVFQCDGVEGHIIAAVVIQTDIAGFLDSGSATAPLLKDDGVIFDTCLTALLPGVGSYIETDSTGSQIRMQETVVQSKHIGNSFGCGVGFPPRANRHDVKGKGVHQCPLPIQQDVVVGPAVV